MTTSENNAQNDYMKILVLRLTKHICLNSHTRLIGGILRLLRRLWYFACIREKLLCSVVLDILTVLTESILKFMSEGINIRSD